jgi:hypothetical protein
MQEFLSNIIPRIRQYSKDLNKTENFVDKNWIFLDENNIPHEYLFLRDKRMLLSAGNSTKEGTWELLPTGHLLINRGNNDLIKLENLFIEKALLVLRISGTNDIPFVLINPKELPKLDVEVYLEKYEHEKEIQNLPPAQQKYRVFKTGEIAGPEFYVGKVIKTVDGLFINGTYRTTWKDSEQYAVIVDNQIVDLYYHVVYWYNNLKIKIRKKSSIVTPSTGDKIIYDESFTLPHNQKVCIKSKDFEEIEIEINKEDFIVKVYGYNGEKLFIILLVFLLLFFAVPIIASFLR